MRIRSDRSQVVDERERMSTVAPPATADPAFTPPERVVAAPVEAVPVGSETVLTSSTSGFTPSAIVAAVVGIALMLLGGITMARAGVDSSLDEPVVDVAGFSATALLGIIELVFGLVLLAAALSRSRHAVLFFGIAGGVMALVAVFQPSVGEGSLAIERGFAVLVAIAMGAVVLAALLPTVRRSSVVQRTTDVV